MLIQNRPQDREEEDLQGFDEVSYAAAPSQETGLNSSGEANPPFVPNPYGFPQDVPFDGGEMYSGGLREYDGRGTVNTGGDGGTFPGGTSTGVRPPADTGGGSGGDGSDGGGTGGGYEPAQRPTFPSMPSMPPAPPPPGVAPQPNLPAPIQGTSFGASNPHGDLARLSRYAAEWMASPGRYDDDFVSSSMQAIRERMAEVRRETSNATNANLAARGILSSTAGGELYGMEQARVGRMENEENLALLRQIADAHAQDRGAAFGAGATAAGMQEQARQFGVSAGLQARAQDLTRYGIDSQTAISMARMQQDAEQFGAQYALSVRAQDLQRMGMEADIALRQAQMEFNFMQSDRDEAYRRDGMALDEDYRRDRFGFEQDAWEDNRQYRDDFFSWTQDDRKRYWDWLYARDGIEIDPETGRPKVEDPPPDLGPGGGYRPPPGGLRPGTGGSGNPWDPGYGFPDDPNMDPDDWRQDWDPFR